MDTRSMTTVEDVGAIASEIVGVLKQVASVNATVVALHGDLGAGKTTLVQHIAKTLGIVDTVTSPTFVVMKQYETTDDDFTELVHIDAYRIESDDEMRPLGFEQITKRPHTLVCIEWAERIATLLPETTIHITLELQPDGSRTLTYGNKT